MLSLSQLSKLLMQQTPVLPIILLYTHFTGKWGQFTFNNPSILSKVLTMKDYFVTPCAFDFNGVNWHVLKHSRYIIQYISWLDNTFNSSTYYIQIILFAYFCMVYWFKYIFYSKFTVHLVLVSLSIFTDFTQFMADLCSIGEFSFWE